MSQETLLINCIKELIERRIDFIIGLSEQGGYIENNPIMYEQEYYFYIHFIDDNTVTHFSNGTIINITTIDELLKIKPFI